MDDGHSTIKLGKASVLYEKESADKNLTISTCIQCSGTLHTPSFVRYQGYIIMALEKGFPQLSQMCADTYYLRIYFT